MADNDVQLSSRNWIATLNKARENCREKVARAMVEIGNPNQMQWPLGPSHSMGRSHRAAMEAHVSIIDYADQVKPFREEDAVEELWGEMLADKRLPVGDKKLAISLADLEEWEIVITQSKTEKKDELRGTVQEQDTKRVLLPVWAMRALYRQLNDVVTKLGFAADPDSTPRSEIDDELLDRVNKWQKQQE